MKYLVLVILHLLLWIFISLIILFWSETVLSDSISLSEIFLTRKFLFVVCIFYISYFSFPFLGKRTSRFLWVALIYMFLIGWLWSIDPVKSIKELLGKSLWVFTPVFIFNTVGFMFRAFVGWFNDKKIKAELQKEKLETQMELLKAKLNPHFLFNTLNNIDILIMDEPLRASEYLKKLSEILRFMLYETNDGLIPLSNEIEHIQKFIDLQKIRTSNTDFVDMEVLGNPRGKCVAPMIFVHFIENAFKFASNKKIKNAISVKFEILDKSISFKCRNHIDSTDLSLKDHKGLGIQLIQKRLDLVYKKNYTLKIVDEGNWYNVDLDIKINT